MRKSRSYIKVSDQPLKQQACTAAFVTQAATAFDEAASAVHRQAVSRYFLEAALALDGAAAPHQPVVPCLEGLRLSADRHSEGLTGGGWATPVQHNEVCREREGLLLPAVYQDRHRAGHARMVRITSAAWSARPGFPRCPSSRPGAWTAWWGPGSSRESVPSC